MAYFPMFIKIEKELCLVVGGGAVALRKVRVLLDFGARVKVVAERILPEIREMGAQGQAVIDSERCSESGDGCGYDVVLCERSFSEDDLEGCAMVIAATGNAALNHTIAELSRARGIPVNAVDQPEDCTFIFPSYVREQNLVGAISSGGNSPVITQYLRGKLACELTEDLGRLNEYMGSIRPVVRAAVPTEAQRRQVYRSILQELLEKGETKLPQERLQELLTHYNAI